MLERKIPFGKVEGRIDHLAVDLARHRLFVAELGNGSVGVVDLEQGKVLERIGGLKEPQGVGYVPGPDTVYVASAGDGTLRRYAGEDLKPLGVTELGDDADNVRLDPRTGRWWSATATARSRWSMQPRARRRGYRPRRPSGVVPARGRRQPDFRERAEGGAGGDGGP